MTLKSKGFARTADAENKITFSLMRRQVEQVMTGQEAESVVIQYTCFRTTNTHQVYTKLEVRFSYCTALLTFRLKNLVSPFLNADCYPREELCLLDMLIK